VVVVPLAILVGGLRLCSRDAGARWVARVQRVDEHATLAIDRSDVIAIAPDQATGEDAGEYAVAFRAALEEHYGDLLGTGDDQLMVVVVFSRPEMVQEYAGRDVLVDRKALGDMMGYTDPSQNAVFLPPEPDLTTLRHEVVHLLMGQATEGRARFSPWLMEGLAQYFERYDPPNEPSFPPSSRALARAAMGGRTMDVQRLIRIQDYAEFVGEQGQRNYFEAQILVAFLMEERPRAVLREYIDAEKSHLSSRYEMFTRIIGDPQGPLATELRRYLGG